MFILRTATDPAVEIVPIGLSSLAFFYLLTHALFKASLFTCAGGVTHSIGDPQDTRFMGALSIYIRFSSSCLTF